MEKYGMQYNCCQILTTNDHLLNASDATVCLLCPRPVQHRIRMLDRMMSEYTREKSQWIMSWAKYDWNVWSTFYCLQIRIKSRLTKTTRFHVISSSYYDKTKCKHIWIFTTNGNIYFSRSRVILLTSTCFLSCYKPDAHQIYHSVSCFSNAPHFKLIQHDVRPSICI